MSIVSRCQLFCLSTLLICALAGPVAVAQLNCPAPWASAQNVYGIVTLDGTGSGSSGSLHETADQHAVVAGKLAGLGPGSCTWQAIPQVGFGQMKSQANENDVITDSQNPSNNAVWAASGAGDPLWDSMLLEIIPSAGQYVVGAFGAVPGTLTTYQGTINEDIIWGSTFGDGGVSEQQIPFPPSAPFLYGTHSYQLPPFDNAQGGSIANVNWTATWLFTPVPDGTCKDCKDKRGSEVSIRNQSLGEDIAIVGTPFSLHYESERTAGRAGADLVAVKDALSLGAWTLDVHHVFEPLLMVYCAGGSCTPYSIVPKALYLGDGTVRTSAEVQAPLVVGSNFDLTSEDGSEIYVFDSASGKHKQTLLPMTGAVLYNFGYDSNGLLITVTDGSGNVTTIQRDVDGHPTAIVSPYGQTTTLTVDANGYLSQVTDPMGNTTKLTTSSLGLLSSFTDANGNHYSFQYDGNGFLTKDSDPAGGVINLALTNNASGYSVAETTAQGRVNTNKVAFSNTGSSTTQQYTNTWTNGLQASETDSQQNGQLTESLALPNGGSSSITSGPDPRWGIQAPLATTETMTIGNLTMNIGHSRTVSLSNPPDPFSLISQTDTETINGRVYKSIFTASTKTLVDTTAGGRVTTTVLDELERVASIQFPGTAAMSLSYDNRGRLASATQGARLSSLTYDANGQVASITNPLNLTRSFTYDLAGRVLTTTLEDGRVITYTYDADGNLSSITPPGSLIHNFGYSSVNLPVSYSPPPVSGSGATTYSFSQDRELTKLTRPDGQTVNYNYDADGRISSLVTPSSTLNFAYDPATGNLANASGAGGETITYAYNGALQTGSTWTGTVAGSVGRAYNNNFWVTSQTINGGSNIAFTYDKDGLVKKAGAITIAHNSKSGLYTGGTLGTAKDTLAYDAVYAEQTAHTSKFGTTILYKANYTRDKLGRIATLKDTVGGTVTTYTYAYDAAGRLTGVKNGKNTLATYTYDTNSNRLSATTPSGTVSAAYDAQDRLLTYGNVSYTYTANGELAAKTSGSQVTTYQYDTLGNLVSARLPDGTQLDYIIDAGNHRVGKKRNGILIEGFLYDRDKVVAQLDANNQVVTQFVYGSGGGTPDYFVAGGVTYRVFSDHRGSPRLVVDSTTGQIAERIDYDEFGNVVNDTNPGFQPFGFAGGLYDQDTKLVRFGARDYDAVTGRWTAKDPIFFSGADSNLYGYVLNDPINMVDPNGTESKCICQNKLWNYGWGVADTWTDFILAPLMPPLAIAQLAAGANSPPDLARMASGTSSMVNKSSQAYANGQTTVEVVAVVADVATGVIAEKVVGKAIAKAAREKAARELKNKKLCDMFKKAGADEIKTVLRPKGANNKGLKERK